MTETEKEEVRSTVREELQEIFGVANLASNVDDPLHASVLRYMSRITQVHTNTEVQKYVDAVLGKALQMYCEVNKLEEQQMLAVVQTAVQKDVDIRNTLKKMMRDYVEEVVDRFAQSTTASSYNPVQTAKQAFFQAVKQNLPY